MHAESSSWDESPWVVMLAGVVFPPLGLALLWKRKRPGVLLKLAASVAMAAIAVAYLFMFFGLRVELDGSARKPIISFSGSSERHFEELERSRAEQRQLGAGEAVAAAVSEAPRAVAREGEAARGAPPAAPPVPAYWTDFRGPKRDGHYREMPILTDWPAGGLEEIWRQPVGEGYASFVVAGGKAFTIEQRRDHEVVAAYDMETGREVWTNSWRAHFQESMGGPGPRATPTWRDGKLYALGAEGELRCLDAETGKVIWAKNILRDNGAQNLSWAMAASPLVVDDKVIVLPGGRNGKSVVAYHKDTGEAVWRVLDDPQAYTSPMVVTLAGQRQLLVVSRERAMGLTVEEGKLLWDYPWTTSYGVNAAQPVVVDENRFFLSAGYGHGAALVEVRREQDRFRASTVWETNRMKNKFSASVLHDGHIYGLDEAILACLDVETGRLRWKGGRYGYGQVLLASGHLIVITETGDLVLVKATPERHEEVARFSALRGKTWNNPAIDGGRLLVRNTREMACYRITPQ